MKNEILITEALNAVLYSLLNVSINFIKRNLIISNKDGNIFNANNAKYFSMSTMRSDKKEALKICDAILVEPFVLKVFFNNSENRIIDFRPFFNTLKGDYKKYNTAALFKKFIISNGELWWGKNADIQFHPIDVYYNSLLNPLHDELTEDLIVL